MTRDIDVPAETAERLRADTRRAAEREDGGRSDASPPAPGDLYVSPATAEHDVEWLLAARHGDRILAVAADPGRQVGSGDVEVPGDEPGGPLVLHCRCAAWVDAATFDAAHRTGRLNGRWAETAHQRWRRLESGALNGSPLERETDADPLYQDRAEELAAARDALLRHAAEVEHRRRRERFERGGAPGAPAWLRATAAVLLVALVAALWWGSGLVRRLEELSGPMLLPSGQEVRLGSELRGETEVTADGEGGPVTLSLVRYEDLPDASRYRLVIEAASGDELWAGERELTPYVPVILTLPRTDFPPGTYTLRIEDATSDPPRALDEETLRILPAQ